MLQGGERSSFFFPPFFRRCIVHLIFLRRETGRSEGKKRLVISPLSVGTALPPSVRVLAPSQVRMGHASVSGGGDILARQEREMARRLT